MAKKLVKPSPAATVPVKARKKKPAVTVLETKAPTAAHSRGVALHPGDSLPEEILEEIQHLHSLVHRRAFEISETRGDRGNELAHWLEAEREIVWRPPVELSEENNSFVCRCAVAGLEPEDIRVEITPNEVTFTSTVDIANGRPTERTHFSEFSSGRLFRTLAFPKPVNPHSAEVTVRNGIVAVTAEIVAHV